MHRVYSLHKCCKNGEYPLKDENKDKNTKRMMKRYLKEISNKYPH